MATKKLSDAGPVRVSYSAVQTIRECEQRYFYAYVKKLKPKVERPALELGSMIHAYFDSYYGALINPASKVSVKSLNSLHSQCLDKLNRLYGKKLRGLADLARSASLDDVAAEYAAMPKMVESLARAYHRVHGLNDIRQHQIVAVEQFFELPAAPNIVLPGKIDMITRTREGYWLWEHKTTGNVPEKGTRFRDLQTLLYAVAVEELHGIKLCGIVWNFVRTKPPHPPAALQKGGISVAKDQVTTKELVLEALLKYGLATKEYSAFLQEVQRRERMVMFPRFSLPIVQQESVLLRDYLQTAARIEYIGTNDDYPPVRSIGISCDWCPFVKLCQAVITGGDEDDLRRRHFLPQRDEEEKGGDLNSDGDSEIEALLEALD